MELLEDKDNNEGVEFLTLDFRDAFKQLHVVASERPFLAGAAMGGFFSYRTVLFGVGSGPLVWCVGCPLGSSAALRLGYPTAERRPTVSWMTLSSHSKARHIKGAGWPWVCCCGGALSA